MRRAIFVVVVLLLAASAVSAQSNNIKAAMYMTTVYVASPMRTYEQALYSGGRDAAILVTNDADAPYLLISGTEIIVCVAVGSGDQLKSAADAYVRDLNRGRAYIVEAFADRFTAQLLMDRLQNTTYSFFDDVWVAERSNGGAFLVYRNPAL